MVQILTDLFDYNLIDIYATLHHFQAEEIRKDFNLNSQFSILNYQFAHQRYKSEYVRLNSYPCFSLMTIFTPFFAQRMICCITDSGTATHPAVYFLLPLQCRKIQLPLWGTPSAL